MKKLVLLLSVCALMLTSCNSDDDSGSQDLILGTWTYHKLFIDDVEAQLTACDMQETFVFNENGTYSYAYYELIQGVCELEESDSGTWANDGNSIYTLSINGQTASEDITFEDNMFYFEYAEIGDPADPVLVTYKEVYISN